MIDFVKIEAEIEAVEEEMDRIQYSDPEDYLTNKEYMWLSNRRVYLINQLSLLFDEQQDW